MSESEIESESAPETAPETPEDPQPLEIHGMRADHVAALSRLLTLIEHHKQIERQLEGQIETILSIGYGANLQTEHWDIDIEHGVLRRMA